MNETNADVVAHARAARGWMRRDARFGRVSERCPWDREGGAGVQGSRHIRKGALSEPVSRKVGGARMAEPRLSIRPEALQQQRNAGSAEKVRGQRGRLALGRFVSARQPGALSE